MKIRVIYKFAAALSLLCCVGCNDMLTQENPNKMSTETYWRNLSETKTGLFAAYAALRNDNVLSLQEESWRADLAWPGYGRPTSSSNEIGWSWYNQQYTASTTAVTLKWDALYAGVWRANQVIEALDALDEVTKEENIEEWSFQMGQAKFLRGLFYFYLHSSFNEGSIVLRNKSPKNMEDYNTPLSSSADVLKFFRQDLTDAYALLKEYPSVDTSYSSFATYGTVQTILGTSYLYEKEYAEAKLCFEEVMNCGLYKLETDISKMFTDAGEFNSESILEIPYSADLRTDINEYNVNSMSNVLATVTMQVAGCYLPAWLAVAYETEKMDPNNPINDLAADVPAVYKRNVSLRASAMATLVIDEVTPYYLKDNMGYFTNSCGAPNGVYGVGRYKKYTNHDILEKELVSKSGRNVIVNRLSDVILMYAECLIQEGKTTEAVDQINRIRKRWGLQMLGVGDGTDSYDGVSYTATTLMDHLMYVERPLELSHEGHQIRWQDLRRWGLLEDNDKNIFKKHASEAFVFYNYSPKHLPGVTIAGKEERKCALAVKVDPANTASPIAPTDNDFVTKYSAILDATAPTIDYEYDGAAQYYKKSDNAYYPIPDTEVRNNSSLQK